MSQQVDTQVLVVGGGPGGYVAAIRAGQLGLKTTLVEADRLGGTCLMRGCIPSKAMIHVAGKLEEMLAHVGQGHQGIRLSSMPQFDMAYAVQWKNSVVDRLNSGVAGLLKRAGVRVVAGWAQFEDAKHCVVASAEGALRIRAEQVILATGSMACGLPHMPFDGQRVLSSTEALDLPALPASMAVVGAGYIGLELGIAFAKLGCKVSLVEAQDRILPLYDQALVKPVEDWLRRHDIDIHLEAKASALTDHALLAQTAGGEISVAAEKVLVTVGRQPNTAGWGLENMPVERAGVFVKVDEACRTSVRGVYAIGDLVGEPMLAHKASAQGEMVAELIAGHKRAFEPRAIAAVCFTEPEIVGVGLSPDDARAQGLDITVGEFPLRANGRALSMDAGADGGFVRITARADNHLVLGIHAVGRHVSELSGEFAHALEMGARLDDIAGTIHVHPTLSEAFHEAALSALGQAIHF